MYSGVSTGTVCVTILHLLVHVQCTVYACTCTLLVNGNFNEKTLLAYNYCKYS